MGPGRKLALGALLTALLLLLASQPARTQQSCHLRELDLCAASMLVLTQAPSGLASNDAEINKQCQHLREADSCLRNYSRRCMTPMQRELMSLASNSTLGLMDEYCTRGSKLRQNYLKHATCFNQLQKKQEHKGCLRDLQASLELLGSAGSAGPLGGSSSSSNGKEKDKLKGDIGPQFELNGRRLELACCAYRRFESCLGGQLEKRCGKEALHFVQSTLRRASSRLPELVCRQLKPTGPECRELLPKPGTSPRGAKSNSIVSRLLSAYSGL